MKTSFFLRHILIIAKTKMLSEQRASIAAFCAMAVNGHGQYSSVFDYSRSCYVPMSITCNAPSSITIFDFKRSCYVQGSSTSIFDYGTRAYLSLTVQGNTVSGFDYASRKYFTATINQQFVSLFDYQTNRYYNFHLS